ncbi:MAG: redoxin domain-containing protein [Bacteroidales bacterium]
MNTILISMMMSGLITFFTPGSSSKSSGANSPLAVGSEVPEFSLPDQNGKIFDLKSVLGKENLVIFFYVKDETPVCTKEVCTFRDNYSAFRDAGAAVIGISSQSIGSHKEFSDKYKLPYELLADTGNKVRDLFGVNNNGPIPERVTFVINKQGKVVYVYDSMTKPVEHVTEALRILKQLS